MQGSFAITKPVPAKLSFGEFQSFCAEMRTIPSIMRSRVVRSALDWVTEEQPVLG
jgi:hypothetical protein